MLTSKIKVANLTKISNKLQIQRRCYCKPTADSVTKTTPAEKPTQKNVTKADLQWRTPWQEKQGEWYSNLKVFANENNQSPVMKWLQTPIDLRPSTIKNWWLKKHEEVTIANQAFLTQRNEILGNELAAAHFVVHRGGSIKFFGEDKWIKRDALENYSLPTHFNEDKVLQCIDCLEMPLYYEGLANFRGLRQMEWLSLNSSLHIDDWCLDRISNMFRKTLLYLDIRNCRQVTERGLGALYKIETLQTLLLDNITISKEIEMTCLMLQELYPKLEIKIT